MSKILSFLENYVLNIYYAAILSSFIFTLILVPSIVRLSNNMRDYNIPKDRKTHTRAIPIIGGYVILISTTVLFLFFTPNSLNPETIALLGATFLLAVINLRDDIFFLDPKINFISQLVCSFYIILVFRIYISSFDGFLGINELPAYVSVFFTSFFIILIYNSLNLIDGIDNLYNSFCILICFFLGLNFAFIGNDSFSILNFLLVGGLIGITYYNIRRENKNRTFMGNGGTTIKNPVC